MKMYQGGNCVYCGKLFLDHKSKTFHCPIDRKSRTMGHSSFSTTSVFRVKIKYKRVALPEELSDTA
jgi:hypothetical protein